MYSRISACRICGNTKLVPVVDLGEQYLTGVFPTQFDVSLTRGPLKLVKCHGPDGCALLQLEHNYNLGEMYGENYGYRSGLNKSMVRHLHGKVANILDRVKLEPSDLVIDVGANDGTTLGAYPADLVRVGIDPTGEKFQKYYPEGVRLIPDFFSAALVKKELPGQQAKVVTSFSMFYDLEDPVDFARQIASILAPDGVWILEQSYMPLMLERNAYDTICHEHLEYYGLHQIVWITDRAGLRVIDVELNDVNGGSFSVVVAHRDSPNSNESGEVGRLLEAERLAGLIDSLVPYQAFAQRTEESRVAIRDFLMKAKSEGKVVCGLGASTKGNVVLQYCGLTADDIPLIGEVNPDKYGRVTPGSWIPIADEADVLASAPDYLLVLPWHFRQSMLTNHAYAGRTLLFPLPTLEAIVAG